MAMTTGISINVNAAAVDIGWNSLRW